MSVATSTAIAIAAGAGAAGSLGSAAIGAHAAGKAADAQTKAAQSAQQLQAQQAQQALGFQNNVWGGTQQALAPYLQSGQAGLSALNYGLGLSGPGGGQQGQMAPGVPINSMMNPGGNPNSPPGPNAGIQGGRQMGPMAQVQGGAAANGGNSPVVGSTLSPNGPFGAQGSQGANPQGVPLNTMMAGAGVNPLVPSGPGSLIQPWSQQFTAPTDVTEQNDPGFQFRLQQGQQALQRSAAAQGNLLTGNTARDLQSYGQNEASNEYNSVYNRALGQYQQQYNIFENNQANAYNRLAAQAGMGQQAAGQLGAFGQNAASNAANILMGAGAQQGQALQNAGAARASGYAGAGNAWAGGVSGLGTAIGGGLTLSQLMKNQGGGYPPDFGSDYGAG